MAQLEYGVNQQQQIIHISQVNSGRINLQCPYCDMSLIARKGQVTEHHFAHDGETCLDSSRDFESLDVPFWDKFHSHIRAKAWKKLSEGYDDKDFTWNVLTRHKPPLSKYNTFSRAYELTDYGAVPFGDLTLSKFAKFQINHITERHQELSETIDKAFFGQISYEDYLAPVEIVDKAITDLNIYCSQVRRVFKADLYLLEIEHEQGRLYKIGLTSRNIEARIAEIQRDLKSILTVKKIDCIRLLKRRGAIERYALHRYQNNRVILDNPSLLEYFAFNKKEAARVKADFTRCGDYELGVRRFYRDYDDWKTYKSLGVAPHQYTQSGLISSILNEQPARIVIDIAHHQAIKEREALIEQERQRQKAIKVAHRQATIKGMQVAKDAGQHIGRPHGTRHSDYKILAKYLDVIEALNEGLSLRAIASKTKKSVNTIRKVKAILDEIG